ncbi:MAG: hypothetical protein QF551_02815 [Candidatus Marinimicrobia bacterium]|jgi:hypothetical protein|nr:hypothetical protein [Candidatus Neomarinimicrobiota bacterium]MDP6966188.1 hypothetical protein [Candidatus Neomarinimicrobiota bacterium]|tara:strand:+ start:4834 stop:5517 length:684 start_codon:yes stop_codon:yes gene_type:complete
MKFCLLLFVLKFTLAAAPLRHEIVFIGGELAVGRVSEIGEDTLRFQSRGSDEEQDILLDSVLYVHNNAGKLFYVSKKLRKFVNRATGRGGVITTVDGDEFPYTRLDEELFMYTPKLVYFASDTSLRQTVNLEKIHKVRIDHTLSEYAVKKGALAGTGLTVLRFLLNFKALKEFFNFSKVFNTAWGLYPDLVTHTPVISIGWLVYDYFKGERELILNPTESFRVTLKE